MTRQKVTFVLGGMLGENAVREAGVDWTILRPTWFSQNFSEGFLADPVRSGEVALPAGMVPERFVDAEDIADGVQRALGRAPRDFVDYARAAAAVRAWNS
jgi:uncharacterized protein YbjT (DUF2867 family)